MSLPRLFLAATLRLLGNALRGLAPLRRGADGRLRVSLVRPLITLAFVVPFALVQGLHWLGFLLDEIFFRGYRRVEIKEPLFVLGVPRSGTTHLHRVLAEDHSLTTFSTWECLFAPSVSERRLWLAVAALDARIGRPLSRLLGLLERAAFGGMDAVHAMTLADPEEDYFALTAVLASFILVLPFPEDRYLWRMGHFDRDMPEDERRRLLAFYRGCLQRHLYVHGPDKRLLSKNAAFAPLAGGLRDTFPDARFLVCLREPERTLPSQLSSVAPGVHFFRVTEAVPDFNQRLTRQLGFYYENLESALGGLAPERCAWVTLGDLEGDLAGSVNAAYRQLGLPLSETFGARLDALADQSRTYRSDHSYTAEQFGLSHTDVGGELHGLYRRMAARSVRASRTPPPDEPESPASRTSDAETPSGPRVQTEPALPC